MTLLRRQTILLFAVPAVSSLVPRLSFQPIQSVRNSIPSTAQYAPSNTALSLGIDPTEAIQHVNSLSSHTSAMDLLTTDLLSTMFTATADITKSIVPNSSLPPLTDTIQSGLVTAPDLTSGNSEFIIPDITSMPGGAPRSGNPFLAESFREIFNGPLKLSPRNYDWSSTSSTAPIVIPARELDITARYADLLSRIPFAAALYACLDFFFINAEEDIAIAQLLDEDEAEDLLDVEGGVVLRRFVGLMAVVVGTITWSGLTYHPVPFGQL